VTVRPRVVFVTGKLAEPALRRVVGELAGRHGFEPEIAVLPITVAALLTTDWVARHLQCAPGASRAVLPGFCRGPLDPLTEMFAIPFEIGPRDLHDLPEYFGDGQRPAAHLNAYDIEVIAEINHAPRLPINSLLATARVYRNDGADVIDLGCEPGFTWSHVGDAVRALRDEGLRVSIDSLNPYEIAPACRAGAELVLSVNSSNRTAAADWGVEVVAIPDEPANLTGLDATVELLHQNGVPFRIDPILEPIGFGFAASLGRYLDVRRRHPDAAMMMGVGNLTELTDVDSAGVNVLLSGFCQELGVRSVLTTQVINWCRSCVRELDLARRLAYHAVTHRVLPKKLTTDLLTLRDPKVTEFGEEGLRELAERVTDRNFRLFAERGTLHMINRAMHLTGDDPFDLFAEAMRRDPNIDPAHAFYLGYELCKAVLALTLGKQYTQDQSLRWGYLTRPEVPRHPPRNSGPSPP